MASQVAERIQVEATRISPRETGGVLLGYLAGDSEFVVTHATLPGPSATHEEERYLPDDSFDESEIARIYADSGRRSTYLGDWHSHPGGTTGLSLRDRRTLRLIASHPAARARFPLMIIAAGKEPWTIAAWSLAPKDCIGRRRSLPLIPVVY